MNYRKGERPPHYRLMADCLVLLTSLVLTEPHMTSHQRAQFGPLIKRLKKAIEKPVNRSTRGAEK